MHSQSADVFLSCTQGDNNFHLLLYSVDIIICVSVCVHVFVCVCVRLCVCVCVCVGVYVFFFFFFVFVCFVCCVCLCVHCVAVVSDPLVSFLHRSGVPEEADRSECSGPQAEPGGHHVQSAWDSTQPQVR